MLSRKHALLSMAAGGGPVILFFLIAIMTDDPGQVYKVLVAALFITLGAFAFVNAFKNWRESRFCFNAPLFGMATLCLLLALVLFSTQ